MIKDERLRVNATPILYSFRRCPFADQDKDGVPDEIGDDDDDVDDVDDAGDEDDED